MTSAQFAEQISRSLQVFPDIVQNRVEVLEHDAGWEIVMDVTVHSDTAVERIIDSVTHELIPGTAQLLGAPPIARRLEFRLPDGAAVHAEVSPPPAIRPLPRLRPVIVDDAAQSAA